MEEIIASYRYEKYRFENSGSNGVGTSILDCVLDDGRSGVIKVDCELNELTQGMDYRWYGRWVEHKKYGPQFHAQTFVEVQPRSRVGVINYLRQAPNIGSVTARKLWDLYGETAVETLRTKPDLVADAIGGQLNSERAQEAAAYLIRKVQLEDLHIDLMGVLVGHGFPKGTIRKAILEWGNKSGQFIRQNPYLLMLFRGCGFMKCDQLYLDLGGDPAKLKRQALSAAYVISRDTDGHTWYSTTFLEDKIRELVSGAKLQPVRACRLAVRAGLLTFHRDDQGQVWLADARDARAEQIVAERVRRWLDSPCHWPAVSSLDVSEHQREKLAWALQRPISILSGGPGTGKSYSAGRVIGAIIDTYGSGSVAVAAPTGKAAVRITEVMQGYGLNVRATTIHSLLSVMQVNEGEGWRFEHDEKKPLPFKFVVVDESSMIDTTLAASLFRACGQGTHILLVGDTGQLPPVGHGAPLRDLIEAGVPCGELTEIRRNSGQIVRSCHYIRAGKQFPVNDQINLAEGANLKLLGAASAKSAIDRIIATIRQIGSRGLAHPIWECQVIVAVNAKSELSRHAINQRLQAELNPHGKREGDNPFRVSDKVVCLKNTWTGIVQDSPSGFNDSARDDKVFVANGEQGDVKYVEDSLTVVQLDAPPRLVRVPRGKSKNGEQDDSEDKPATGCQWDLAYAISCHKSQGSEYKVVFVVLDEHYGARMVCSREWLYTACSRAKEVCFLVGKLQTAYSMLGQQAIKKRKTFLAHFIAENAQ